MSGEIFCYAYIIFALEHVDQHVDEVVEVRVELDGVHKIARDAAHHVVQSGVRSAEAAQWRQGHHCGVVWPRGIRSCALEVEYGRLQL